MLSISCDVTKYFLTPQYVMFLFHIVQTYIICSVTSIRVLALYSNVCFDWKPWLLIINILLHDILVKVGNTREVQFLIKLFILLCKESTLIVCSEQFKIVDHVHKLFLFLLFDWPQANWLPVVISESLMGVTRGIYRKSTNVFVIVPTVATGICSERTKGHFYLSGAQTNHTARNFSVMSVCIDKLCITVAILGFARSESGAVSVNCAIFHLFLVVTQTRVSLL